MVIGIVRGEASDPAKVGCNGTLAEAIKLDKAVVFLIPLAGSDDVMLFVFFA